MIELLGGLLGAATRVVPEIVSLVDKRSERKHELEMLKLSSILETERHKRGMEITRLQGDYGLDTRSLDAFIEATRAQGRPSGIPLADALSALVRPILTFWWALVLYTVVLLAKYTLLVDADIPATEAIVSLWGAEERAIVSSILSFWFLDRVFSKFRK